MSVVLLCFLVHFLIRRIVHRYFADDLDGAVTAHLLACMGGLIDGSTEEEAFLMHAVCETTAKIVHRRPSENQDICINLGMLPSLSRLLTHANIRVAHAAVMAIREIG